MKIIETGLTCLEFDNSGNDIEIKKTCSGFPCGNTCWAIWIKDKN